ncbi:MAG: YeeE/YedE family protein [Methylococcales bacterium]|nr:YeeE/YedE family protein [Methylococcales bacterium]MDD5753681.1 YeeE/YedE family protein [Methylococcales bacterium]
MENFTPYSAFFGGSLIGLSAALLLYFNGRIAGISGIIAGAFSVKDNDRYWRFFFLIGLILAAVIFNLFVSSSPAAYSRSTLLLVISGILVGYGTRLGSGCTSGHAVCGMARLSMRSIAATITFMFVAMLTVFITRHLFGVSQ